MHITEITVRNLRAPERGQVTFIDDSLKGFGVRVSQGGTKTFTLVYGRNRERVSIGRFPIISLAEARGQAKRLLAEYALGRRRPRSIRFDDALSEFFVECEQRNRPRTVRDYRRLMGRYFKFGRMPLSEITHEDVAAKLPKAPAERNHALVVIKIFLSWAQKPPRRYIPHNPCEGMSPTRRASRKRVLSAAELSAVIRAALAGIDPYSQIVGLLVCTGQRRGEITALQRSWINAEERTIVLPDRITKNKQEHQFPYGKLAGKIIEDIPRLDNTDYLFPAARGHVRGKPTTTFNGFQKAKIEFDKCCAVSGWTLHDLRRTFGTKLAELKVPPHIVERLLNHKMGSITNKTDGIVSAVAEIYNRATYMPEMRRAIAIWEKYLGALIARN